MARWKSRKHTFCFLIRVYVFCLLFFVYNSISCLNLKKSLPCPGRSYLWKCLLITSLSLRTRITSKPVNLYVLWSRLTWLVYAFDFSIKGSERGWPSSSRSSEQPCLMVVLSSQASCTYIWPSPLPFELGKLCTFIFSILNGISGSDLPAQLPFPYFPAVSPVT